MLGVVETLAAVASRILASCLRRQDGAGDWAVIIAIEDSGNGVSGKALAAQIAKILYYYRFL